MNAIARPTAGANAARIWMMITAPAVIIFISSNVVNVGNLAFNMVFSRLMGPETFVILAMLTTAKLAVLGVMGAVQMAVSQRVAATAPSDAAKLENSLSRINRLSMAGLGLLALLLSAILLHSGSVDARSLLPAPHLIVILLAALPFGAALSLLRGVVFGRIATGRIVASANVEMLVRLIGGIIAWQMGFGITGVAVAIALSIIAGWIVLADILPARGNAPTTEIKRVGIAIGTGAFAFAILQLAQVAAIDGDIFVARMLLDDTQAGYTAALSLFQRIQFFACFSLASVLLPSVIVAQRDGKSLLQPLLPVILLVGAVSVTFLAAVALFPHQLISIMVGDAYLGAIPALLPAAMAAVAFSVSYLAITFLIALGRQTAVLAALAVAIIQLFAMGLTGAATIEAMLWIKALVQIGGAVLALAIATRCALKSGHVAR